MVGTTDGFIPPYPRKAFDFLGSGSSSCKAKVCEKLYENGYRTLRTGVRTVRYSHKIQPKMQLKLVAEGMTVCYTSDGGVRMGQKEKLIARLKTIPRDFTFDEAESLLRYLTFHRTNKGKTSGSRVVFVSDEYGIKILMHKPHPRKELLEYQVRQLIEQLEQEGLI